MSSHQEKPKEALTPIPDVTIVSDDEDEVDLEAVARLAKAKLDQDLADARARNKGIVWKKQEWADRLRKKKEDEDAAEAQQKLEEAVKAAKKKALVKPLVRFFACLLGESETDFDSQTGLTVPPEGVMVGPSKHKVSGG